MILKNRLSDRALKFIGCGLLFAILLSFTFTSTSFNVPVTRAIGAQYKDLNKSVYSAIEIHIKINESLTTAFEKTKTQTSIYEQGFVYSEEIPLSRELQEYIFTRCQEENISYTLVLALIWRESRFVESAVGYNTNGTTDSGLMQINDVNRGWLRRDHGITDLLDAKENIRAGTTLLGMLSSRHGEHYGLLAYEWGEGGMKSRKSRGITTSQLAEILYNKQAEFDQLLYGGTA